MAAFQSGAGKLMGVAGCAADARVMLEALETGTTGVLLRTQDPLQVCNVALNTHIASMDSIRWCCVISHAGPPAGRSMAAAAKHTQALPAWTA